MRRLLLTTLIGPVFCTAQVIVDKPIVLTSPLPEERRITGLTHSTEPTDALTAGVSQTGEVHLAQPVAGNAWAVELPALGSDPTDGTYVVVQIPLLVPGPITLDLNGHGPLPILRNGAAIDGEALVEGSMLSVILAGDAFHIMNGGNDRLRDCPAGTVAVSDQFCVEAMEHGAGDYFAAGLACAGSGLRLCSWAEFVAACQRTTELQLTGMINNWEWTSSTSNEDNSGRIAGLNDCTSAGNWMSTGSAPVAFRCCFSR